MSLIRCITGSESFASGSASLIVTVHPTTRFPIEGSLKGKFISQAAEDANYVAMTQRKVYLPASNNGVREEGAYWDGSYNVPDSLILRVYARRRARNAFGRAVEGAGVVYLRAREDGPLQRLQLNRIDHPHSTNAPVIIEGRYDIISLRDVAAAGGYIETADLQLGKAEQVAAVLTRVDVAPARRAPAKIKVETVRDHDGEEVRVTSTRTKRATNLG